jgi:hypothetical protein
MFNNIGPRSCVMQLYQGQSDPTWCKHYKTVFYVADATEYNRLSVVILSAVVLCVGAPVIKCICPM